MERFKNFINLSKKYVALGLAVTLTLGVVLPVTAVNTQANENNYGYIEDTDGFWEIIEEVQNTTIEITIEEFPQLRDNFWNDINENIIEVQTEIENLDLSSVRILKDFTGYFYITIPITNDSYSILSNISIVYDYNFELKSFLETHITESENGYFKSTIFVNGLLFSIEESDYQFIDNYQLEEELEYLEMMLSNPRARGAWCFALTGLGAFLVGFVTGFCLGICLASALSLCVPCVIGAVMVTWSVATDVANCFNS